ncbi:DUF3108 domain-containing protein [Bizionia gelidisalsuginis]|uniref:DUF3108 domain-containing protein n=1 Tax=Bizionia gelidisalsuginis TaxID=291188 RepID=A0ABY3M936_9FLAO|nr:DUF3108 domain-containing protein [Bizionia gelidisalsuginis]TYC10770.1 DUF3108 domain-containing protein [Bizionia gelidisalsuginis]
MQRLLIVLLLLTSLSIEAQNNAFIAGEKLTFTASYNMSGLMTDLAQVTMETSEVKTSSATLLRLKGTATTYSKWDSFFKIRDLYESYVSPKTVTPYLYKREINEGGYYKYVKYNYNHKTRTVKSVLRKKSKNFESGFWDRNSTVTITAGTRDIMATLYQLRTLDIHKAPVGASDTFTVLFDNKETKFSFTMMGKETLNTALGKMQCYKLKLNVIGNDVLKGNSNFLWLSADQNKIPVFAKFKVAVGSGELRIKDVSGLKN